MLCAAALGLAPALALLSAGCGAAEDGPKLLPEVVAQAAYGRHSGVPYDQASPALRARKQTADDRAENRFC